MCVCVTMCGIDSCTLLIGVSTVKSSPTDSNNDIIVPTSNPAYETVTRNPAYETVTSGQETSPSLYENVMN